MPPSPVDLRRRRRSRAGGCMRACLHGWVVCSVSRWVHVCVRVWVGACVRGGIEGEWVGGGWTGMYCVRNSRDEYQ